MAGGVESPAGAGGGTHSHRIAPVPALSANKLLVLYLFAPLVQSADAVQVRCASTYTEASLAASTAGEESSTVLKSFVLQTRGLNGGGG